MTSLTVEKNKVKTALPPREIPIKFNTFWRLATFPMLLFITFPIVALFLQVTPTDLWLSLQNPIVAQAILTSLRTSFASTLLIFIFGLPVAFLLTQKDFRFSRLVDTFIDLPTVLPPAVAGVALLMAFGRFGLLGSWLSDWGISVSFTSVAVVLAQLFVAAPLFIKAASIGLSSVTPELKQAAALDGATRWQTFRFIILPITWTALLSGLMMSWARALGEFGATIIFAGNFAGRTQTMPLAIYLGFEINLQLALTLSVILISFSFLVLVLVKQLLYSRFTD